jgi:hypothetical protein
MIRSELNNKLIISVEKNNIQHVIQCLKKGADPNIILIENYTEPPLLLLALINCDIEIIKNLLYFGANPVIKNNLRMNLFSYLEKYWIEYWTEDVDIRLYNKSLIETDKNIRKHKEIKKWVLTYDFQKDIIKRFPDSFFEMNKYDLLNEQIKEEYDFLLNLKELNLI